MTYLLESYDAEFTERDFESDDDWADSAENEPDEEGLEEEICQ